MHKRTKSSPKIFRGLATPLTEDQASDAAVRHHRAMNWMPFEATGKGLGLYRSELLGWSQGMMADALGLSLKTYAEMERGRRNINRRLVLAVWAIVLLETGKALPPGEKGGPTP